ncbi:AAA family ATPase [Xanthobacter pseudotagetidis]|uniref:AAA family ATPase n=1 Tax=Xanthobacter pseudotagetidis TaxID=3119911 RepID=UPI003726ECA8
MKLRSLAVNQFKKFTAPARLDGIGDGLSVVVGANEMGKSTLLDALHAALFERHASKAQQIVALQNDRNQAAPVVELAFEVDGGLYRITKRFLKKPFARLDCPDGRTLEGDAAEDALRALLRFEEPGKTGAKAGTLGMWSVLWVKQGLSFADLALPETARSSLHVALESEVGAVLGGKRGLALPQAIEEQRDDLLTKAGKPRGAYGKAVEAVEALAAEIAALAARREDLSKTLEALEAAQERLGRLSAPARDRQDAEELAEARARHARLSELEARIAGAVHAVELRRRDLAAADAAVAERRRLREDAGAETEALAASGARLEAARQAQEAARARMDALRQEVRAAEAAVGAAEDSALAAQAIAAAVERAARIRELEGRLARAEAAEARASEARRKAEAIAVGEAALAAIRKAETEAAAAEARLGAAATLITLDIPDARRAGLALDGRPLAPGTTTVRAVEAVTLDIPERGRITVAPAIKDRDLLLRRAQEAAARLKAALAGAGVASPAEAEAQHALRDRLMKEAEFARSEVSLHAPASEGRAAGAQALADHIAGLRAILTREAGGGALPSRDDAEAALRAAQADVLSARAASQAGRAALTGPEEELARLQADLATLSARHEQAEQRAARLRAALESACATADDAALEAAIATARAALARQEAAIAALSDQRTEETLPQLEARIVRLEQALAERREKRSALQEEIAGLKSRLEVSEAAGLDEAIALKARELELCEAERARFAREAQVLTLLARTLREAEAQAKERYLSPVLKRVEPYLRILFPGARIHFDENLRITGVEREGAHREAFEHLSLGTQEQIAVLVRLAFAEMLVERGEPATVILDDALVFSDDDRIKRMFDILNMAARNVQILVFTCREQVFEDLGGKLLALKPGGVDELMSA